MKKEALVPLLLPTLSATRRFDPNRAPEAFDYLGVAVTEALRGAALGFSALQQMRRHYGVSAKATRWALLFAAVAGGLHGVSLVNQGWRVRRTNNVGRVPRGLN
jgi:hypothetical protein